MTDQTPTRKTSYRSGLASFVRWFDPDYFLLKALSWTGLNWNLKPVPLSAYENHHPIPGGQKFPAPRSHRA